MSEAGYIFTHVASAIAFLTDLNPSQLTDIAPAHFEAQVARCAAAAKLKAEARLRAGEAQAKDCAAGPAARVNGARMTQADRGGGGGGGGGASAAAEKEPYGTAGDLMELSARDLRNARLKRGGDGGGACGVGGAGSRGGAEAGVGGVESGVGGVGAWHGGAASAAFLASQAPRRDFDPFEPRPAPPVPGLHTANQREEDDPPAAAFRARYRFLGVADARTLTLGEVAQLLSDYQDLVGLSEQLLARRAHERAGLAAQLRASLPPAAATTTAVAAKAVTAVASTTVVAPMVVAAKVVATTDPPARAP